MRVLYNYNGVIQAGLYVLKNAKDATSPIPTLPNQIANGVVFYTALRSIDSFPNVYVVSGGVGNSRTRDFDPLNPFVEALQYASMKASGGAPTTSIAAPSIVRLQKSSQAVLTADRIMSLNVIGITDVEHVAKSLNMSGDAFVSKIDEYDQAGDYYLFASGSRTFIVRASEIQQATTYATSEKCTSGKIEGFHRVLDFHTADSGGIGIMYIKLLRPPGFYVFRRTYNYDDVTGPSNPIGGCDAFRDDIEQPNNAHCDSGEIKRDPACTVKSIHPSESDTRLISINRTNQSERVSESSIECIGSSACDVLSIPSPSENVVDDFKKVVDTLDSLCGAMSSTSNALIALNAHNMASPSVQRMVLGAIQSRVQRYIARLS